MTDLVYETSWYKEECAHKMNEFYDKEIKNQDIRTHLGAFTALLARTDLRKCPIIDLGCGTAMLSDFCKDFIYHGSDLRHVLSICAMRNYPQFLYRACDLIKDDLSWIREYPIAVLNGVIDIMSQPLEVLARVLNYCQEYLIIHRQEITENGQTHAVADGPGYGGPSYHSVIARKDFIDMVDFMQFTIVQEIPLNFGNWENGGSSFLLRRRKSFALYDMDYLLYQRYFRGKENGFFVEAGANDGIRQSNTYYFEFYKNWKGILIEPMPEQYAYCERNRSAQTRCIHAALTDDSHQLKMNMRYTPGSGGLMSVVDDENADELMKRVPEKGIPMVVPATTLNKVLSEYLVFGDSNSLHIDLLVLDVEGYELKALRGLDLHVWQVDYILVEELHENDLVQNYLAQFGYTRIDKLSHHDYLYKKA